MKKYLKIISITIAIIALPTVTLSAIFQVIQGGTGASTFTTGNCLKGNGTSAITSGPCGSNSKWATSTDNVNIQPNSNQGLLVNASSSITYLSSLNSTSTYATSTKLSVTYASSTAITLSNHLFTHGVQATDSAGIHFHSNNGTEVAFFGAGGGSTVSFLGGVNIDGTTRLSTGLTGILEATAGTVSVATAGTDYEVPLTFGDGLTRTLNDVDVDTTQNISILSNLTSNGFVKTSGGTGALSIDTTTYESGLTAGDGLTRTSNDFDCDIASGSVFGCLSTTDWTNFNNKSTGNSKWATTSNNLDISPNGLGGIITLASSTIANLNSSFSTTTYATTTNSYSVNATTTILDVTSTTATSTFNTGLAIESTGFVYDRSTNKVGIGTKSPHSLLSLVSSAANTTVDALSLDNIAGGNNWGSKITFDQNGAEKGNIKFLFDPTTNWTFSFTTPSVQNSFWIADSGKVGVGTTSPLGKLSVGNANSLTSFPLFVVASSSSAVATSTYFIVNPFGYVGIGTSSPFAKLSVTGQGTASGLAFLVANSANVPRFQITDGGTATLTGSLTSTGNIGAPTFSATSYITSPTVYAGIIRDSGDNYTFIDVDNANINDTNEANSVKPNTRTLVDTSAVTSVDWQTRTLNTLNGNALLYYNENLKIGIATSSAYAPLSVVGTLGVVAERFHATTSTATSTFMGAIGIGTTTPLHKVSLRDGNLQIKNGQLAVNLGSTTAPVNSTLTLDWNTGNTQRILLTENTRLAINATSSHPIDGGKYIVYVCQDGVGSRTLTWVTPGQLAWGSKGTTTITATANRCSMIGGIYDSYYSKYFMLASTTNILK